MGLNKFLAFQQANNDFYAAPIMGTEYLEKLGSKASHSFHMILTHIVQKDPVYTEFYSSNPGLKLLDNSLFELKYALPAEDVIAAAELVDADILVSPDVIYDGPKTVQNAKDFLAKLKELGKEGEYAIMAVPQGGSVEEWMECYRELTRMEGIHCIGLSIIGMITAMQGTTGTDDIVVNRSQFMQLLASTFDVDSTKWHHLLGMGRGPFELLMYKDLSWVRSNDSSNAWWHGFNGIKYDAKGALKVKLKSEVEFNASLTHNNYDDIVYNLAKQDAIVSEINEWRTTHHDNQSG